MKIRLFIDDSDQIIGVESPVTTLEVFEDDAPPYAFVEVSGRVDDLRIKTHDGRYLFPRKMVQKEDYLIITEWGSSLL